MLEWGAQFNVKIFDFDTIPGLTQENIQTNQKWNKWCVVDVHYETFVCMNVFSQFPYYHFCVGQFLDQLHSVGNLLKVGI